ncbi:hypothetical protein CHCC14820_1599 [Bacillus paralicheniformis]|uniref:Uncharacterized protein n=1 Tax=Bacillus paralicheniformis TaxID=1648923 RepID=A0A6N2GVX3_9BACI|nr:hypothetical protein B4121_3652 [Bacillus paralicheniformis]TWL14082.1 hypothetical protein CHCC16874_2660 [Bacillus licheniformis]TWJ58330.1 hypothetical protein CHCC5021_4541 [Bacillus paralicheniformis]TWJ61770.1 hypothetical protein CHCC5022_2242 [Bacillus paralicheniformis]TWJ70013.1 hypothetical protein CHCC4186_1488 [Bacillus paralicheniformis]
MVKKCNRANKRSYLKEKDLKGPLFYERAFFITSSKDSSFAFVFGP